MQVAFSSTTGRADSVNGPPSGSAPSGRLGCPTPRSRGKSSAKSGSPPSDSTWTTSPASRVMGRGRSARRWASAVSPSLIAAGGVWGVVGRFLLVPPLCWFAAIGYRIVAANRGRLPGHAPQLPHLTDRVTGCPAVAGRRGGARPTTARSRCGSRGCRTSRVEARPPPRGAFVLLRPFSEARSVRTSRGDLRRPGVDLPLPSRPLTRASVRGAGRPRTDCSVRPITDSTQAPTRSAAPSTIKPIPAC